MHYYTKLSINNCWFLVLLQTGQKHAAHHLKTNFQHFQPKQIFIGLKHYESDCQEYKLKEKVSETKFLH